MKLHHIAAAALIVATSAAAQNFNKEITIERDITPSLRSATRVGGTPAMVRPEIKTAPLRAYENVIPAETGATIDTLPAADTQAQITPTPYRGYAAAGYFPTYNLAASAGYRIIDRKTTSLGLWTQFDGTNYRRGADLDPDNKQYHFRRNTVTIGSDFTTIINRAGRLDVSADFTYDNLRVPYSSDNDPHYYGITLFNGDAHWSARNATMAYYVEGDYHNFGFHNSGVDLPTQHRIHAQGGTAYFFDESIQLAGSIGVDFLSTSDFYMLRWGGIEAYSSRTIGLIDFSPAFRYGSDQWKLNFGFKLQFMSHMEKSVNFAPDIRLSYTPLSYLSAFATVDGGKRLNTLAELWEWCPYINPTVAYGASNIPLDATIGVTVGPFAGASVTLKGGYSMANEWLMGVTPTDHYASALFTPVIFTPMNLRSVHGQLTASYSRGDLFGAEASISLSGGERNAWYVNRDGAKIVVSMKAQSHPTDRLDLRASFSMRIGRPKYYDDLFERNLNSLNIGATYAITPAFSVMADVENLLGCHASITPGIPCQGVHGAIGAAIKF